MKKILLLSALIISLNSFGQYIVNQSLGSDSTLVTSKGALKSRIINKVFTDTAQANTQRVKFYDGSQIITITGGNKFWIRDSTLNKWVQLVDATYTGFGSTNTSIGSGYKVAVDGTNDIKSVMPRNALSGDSSTSGQVGVRWGGPLTQTTTTITGTFPQGIVFVDARFRMQIASSYSASAQEPIRIDEAKTTIASGPQDTSYTLWQQGWVYNVARDSFGIVAGDRTNPLTYLNMYPHRFYATTDGPMILGSKYADQYAVDSLIWRMEDRSSFFLLNPGVAEIYAGTAEIELELDDINLDADSIRTIRAANVKPIADSAGWYMKIRNRATGTEADAYWPAGGGGSVPINTLANATGDGTVEVGDNLLTWNFTGLTTNGMSFVSSSTAAGESTILHRVAVSGTNASSSRTTLAGSYSNTHAGTGAINVALQLSAQNGATNVALDIGAGDVRLNNNLLYGNSNAYNDQTGTTYTLLASDNGKIVTISNASAITLTVPASLPAGFNCTVVQKGAGQITLTASSTTINNRQSFTKTKGQYSMVTIVQYTTNTFITQGDME